MDQERITLPPPVSAPAPFAGRADRAEEAAHMLGAMAHPTRLRALCLMMHEEQSVTEMAAALGVSQSGLSQHLAKLRGLGLVKARREGQIIWHRLANPQARTLVETLHRLFCEETVFSAPGA